MQLFWALFELKIKQKRRIFFLRLKFSHHEASILYELRNLNFKFGDYFLHKMEFFVFIVQIFARVRKFDKKLWFFIRKLWFGVRDVIFESSKKLQF
jgi:hypothetical protein